MNDLETTFAALRELLISYRPPLISKVDDPSHFDLWSVKDVEIEGRKRKEIFFAGVTIHKNFVGFYFMPVYVDSEVKQFFAPELLKLLKGKSCFHVRQLDAQLEEYIDQALRTGFELYNKRGWV